MNNLIVGDILEIQTPSGLAYIQISHDHQSYPQVIRALPGIYQERPDDLETLAAKKSLFFAMIPLPFSFDKSDTKAILVGRAKIPMSEAAFPIFRIAVRDRYDKILYWWFWDGQGLKYTADPSDPRVNNLPEREVMSAEHLLDSLIRANG